MALPASDNFNRADANPDASGNWTAQPSRTNIRVYTNISTGISFSYARWTADTFSDHQFSQGTYKGYISGTIGTYGDWFGVCVRMQSGAQTCYEFVFTDMSTCKLYKQVAGVRTVLATATHSLTVNDVLRIEISGSNITCYINAAEVAALTTTDSSIPSGGNAGLTNIFANAKVDDWSGGNVSAPAGGGVPLFHHHLGMMRAS